MGVITTNLTEEILIKSLNFLTKYKRLNFHRNHNRMFEIHPLLNLDTNIQDSLNLPFFEPIYKEILGQQICVYKNQDNELNPYPYEPEWISKTGRFVAIGSSSLFGCYSESWQYLLFDMEIYEFVDYAWQDLLGIDEEKNQIIGRSMRICGNETVENSVYSFNINTRNEVSNIKSLDKLKSHFVKSEIYHPSPNLNKLILLSDTRANRIKDSGEYDNLNLLRNYIVHNQNIYTEDENFQTTCCKLIETYDNFDRIKFSKLQQIILSQNICEFLKFVKEKREPFLLD
jgi:hypothetical protein